MFKSLSSIALSNSFIQVNYYYDTETICFLSKNETVKVRSKDEKLTLEYKLGKQIINNTKISKEIIRPIEVFQKLLQ